MSSVATADELATVDASCRGNGVIDWTVPNKDSMDCERDNVDAVHVGFSSCRYSTCAKIAISLFLLLTKVVVDMEILAL